MPDPRRHVAVVAMYEEGTGRMIGLRTLRRKSLLVTGVAAAAMLATLATTGSAAAKSGAASPRSQGSLADAAAATARFHSVQQAKSAGYGELRDAANIACIDNPAGGMGIHYVNGGLVGDPNEDPNKPELVVYEPMPNGQLQLVALEYVVLKASWEGAGHTDPPSLFGQSFTLIPAGNRYGLPDFYELHVWLWKTNPNGLFEDWNPNVTCAFSTE